MKIDTSRHPAKIIKSGWAVLLFNSLVCLFAICAHYYYFSILHNNEYRWVVIAGLVVIVLYSGISSYLISKRYVVNSGGPAR